MNDTPLSGPDIEDRAANIRLTVSHIISSKQDEMFEQFDRLHRRNISDTDVVRALQSLHEPDLLDAYAEWADIDLREDDNTTMNPAVPDPGDAGSYKLLMPTQGSMISTVEQLALLSDGVVLWTNGGKAGQIHRDDTSHHLSIVGWDGWMPLTREDDDGNWQIVGAEERRTIATYLPAVIMGVIK